MSREPETQREPITDSAWFWLFVFGGAALVALAAIGPKYLRRQASIERQYYARETIVARQVERETNSDGQSPRARGEEGQDPESASGPSAPAHAPPSRLLIPLSPLAGVIAGLLVLATIARAVTIRRRAARSAARDQEAIQP